MTITPESYTPSRLPQIGDRVRLNDPGAGFPIGTVTGYGHVLTDIDCSPSRPHSMILVRLDQRYAGQLDAPAHRTERGHHLRTYVSLLACDPHSVYPLDACLFAQLATPDA